MHYPLNVDNSIYQTAEDVHFPEGSSSLASWQCFLCTELESVLNYCVSDFSHVPMNKQMSGPSCVHHKATDLTLKAEQKHILKSQCEEISLPTLLPSSWALPSIQVLTLLAVPIGGLGSGTLGCPAGATLANGSQSVVLSLAADRSHCASRLHAAAWPCFNAGQTIFLQELWASPTLNVYWLHHVLLKC